MKTSFKLLTFFAAFAVSLASQALAAQTLETKNLETQILKPTQLIEHIQLDGLIEPIRQATVSAQTSGQVKRVYVDVDDALAPNEMLVELDNTEQTARLNQAKAGLNEAQAGLKDADQNFTRIEGIYQRKLASQAQLDQASNQLAAAKARLNRAQAAVAEAQKHFDYTQIKAPYGGIVTERHVEEGNSVSPGQPLMSGLSLEELRVVVALPQKYAASARSKREAQVLLAKDRVLETTSMTFYPYADPATHTFRVRMNLNNPEGDLFPGMLVKVNFPVAEREAIYVPASALVEQSELRAVYVLDAKQKPRLRQVRLGSRTSIDNQQQVEVLAGLEAGEQLVLSPAAALASMEAK